MTLTNEQFLKRMEELHQLEQSEPMAWWYVSFADDGFKGAVIVEARGINSALWEINRRKLNPQGEVLAIRLPENEVPEEKWRYKLLQRSDLEEMWGPEEVKTIGELRKND